MPAADKSASRKVFAAFLQTAWPQRAERLLEQFDLYLNELAALNHMVNLVSRRMPREDYWTHLFLDSLLAVNCMEIKAGEALDFGSGGGLPGIPLKLAVPELGLTLLDSVGKKVHCLEHLISALGLDRCRGVWARLEDFAASGGGGRYDYIFCRSVRLEERYIGPLRKLLKPGGLAVFYKANLADDVAVLPGTETHDVSHPQLGRRLIVTAPRRSFELYDKQGKRR